MQIPAAIHLKLHPNKWQKVNKQGGGAVVDR